MSASPQDEPSDMKDAARNGAAAATPAGSMPGTLVSTARSRSGTSDDFVEIRAIGQRFLLVQCRRNGTPIRTRTFQTIEQARKEANRWCGVGESDWRSNVRPPKRPCEPGSDAAYDGSEAMRIIDQGFAVLHESTTNERLTGVLSFAFFSAWIGPLLIVLTAFAFGLPLSPPVIALTYLVIFAGLIAKHWDMVGPSRVYVDVWQRELIFEQGELNRIRGVRTNRVPFPALLLMRYWQREDDTHAAAFVITLGIGRYMYAPGSGFRLHVEAAGGDPAVAEAKTFEIATKLVAATGIEYLDIQTTRDKRFTEWFNASLRVAGGRSDDRV